MRTARDALRRYEDSAFAQANAGELRKLRAELGFLDPGAYRGISRDPLEAFPALDSGQIEDLERRGVDCHTNEPARRLLRVLAIPTTGDDPGDPYLLPARAAAAQVCDVLDQPEDYEIVSLSRVARGPARPSLGFDVGYWGGDHFSLICDVAVAPRWHPPDPDDYAEVAVRLRGLNAHVLFATRAEAQVFLDYYRTKSWAETEFEPGQFCIIELGAG